MRAPSPRARGEGRDEGASPLGAELRQRLKCRRLVRDPSSCPAKAGKGDHPAQQDGGRGAGLDATQDSLLPGDVRAPSVTATRLHLRRPLHRPSAQPTLRVGVSLIDGGRRPPMPPPPLSRGRMQVFVLAMPLRIRAIPTPTVSKPFHSPPLQKEGRRAPLGAPSGSAPAAVGLKPAARPASTIASSREACGIKAAAPSPYGAHRGHAPRV